VFIAWVTPLRRGGGGMLNKTLVFPFSRMLGESSRTSKEFKE